MCIFKKCRTGFHFTILQHYRGNFWFSNQYTTKYFTLLNTLLYITWLYITLFPFMPSARLTCLKKLETVRVTGLNVSRLGMLISSLSYQLDRLSLITWERSDRLESPTPDMDLVSESSREALFIKFSVSPESRLSIGERLDHVRIEWREEYLKCQFSHEFLSAVQFGSYWPKWFSIKVKYAKTLVKCCWVTIVGSFWRYLKFDRIAIICLFYTILTQCGVMIRGSVAIAVYFAFTMYM